MIDCEHQWNWSKETRFCLKCRQVRTFPSNGENGKVVWQGFDDKRNPLELPAEDKAILANLAKGLGVKKAVECINIPMKLLRAWVGAYCREKKPPKLDQPINVSKEEKPAAPVELSQKSPLSIKVSKGDLLPPFPAFNDKWEAPVQLEWIATYLELVRVGAMK